jgi:hypothetical protein
MNCKQNQKHNKGSLLLNRAEQIWKVTIQSIE